MRNVVVTGSNGFIGRNLITYLSANPNLAILPLDVEASSEQLQATLEQADFVFHLAGTNRPEHPDEFKTGNSELTRTVVETLKGTGRPVPVLLSSSSQAELDNPYGTSKKEAEEAVLHYGRETGAPVYVFRLPNVFGKWSRPNYNSAVATFCHNVAHGLPLQVNDPDRELQLVHIDDVIHSFIATLEGTSKPDGNGTYSAHHPYRIRLGELAHRIQGFPATRAMRELPDIGEELTRLLYSMYLTYLPQNQFSYPLEMKHDARGWLAEFIRTPNAGQIFISTTKPGITRGNHWHHTKTEKFLVIQGEALILFRAINGDQVIKYPVSSDHLEVVDIPPGYTHSITNTGTSDLLTLFWASEPFDPERPDTQNLTVIIAN